MRAFSFVLTLFLFVGHILSPTFASPSTSNGVGKRMCQAYGCRIKGEATTENVPAGTLPLDPYHASETSTAASTPTIAKPQLGADTEQSTGSALTPTLSPTPSRSANAGVALASYDTVLFTVLVGWLATVLAF